MSETKYDLVVIGSVRVGMWRRFVRPARFEGRCVKKKQSSAAPV